MLKGDLCSFSLGEVFQSLAINNHTGTLKITSRDYPPKFIYFDQGKITLFSSGAPGVPRLGEMLLRLGCITQEQLDAALEEQKSTKKLLGKILIKQGLIEADDLRKALETKIREEIYDLFLWKEGHFEFHLDYFPDDLIDDVQRKARISLDANSVTMGGLRQLDEWSLIRRHVKTFNEIVILTSRPYTDSDPVSVQILGKIDGNRSVKEVLKDAPASQFDACKTLHELIEAGHVRLLTIEELKIHAAKASSERKHPLAASILLFATEIEPDNPEHHLLLGDAYAGYYQDDLAAAAHLKAMRLCFKAGNREQATQIGDKILHKTKLADEDLEDLVQGHIALGHAKRASVVGGQLVASLQKKGEFQKAAATLEAVSEIQPKDLNLKVQLATLLERAGEQERAEDCLEDVAGRLEKEKRYRELIRILRLILEINPERNELKRRINELQTLEERRRKRRKRRFIMAGCSAAAFCVLVVAPILYEIKARECFYHAQRLEEIAKVSGNYSQVKQAHEEVIEFVFWNTKKSESRAALARLRKEEQARLDRHRREEQLRKEEQEARMRAMKEALARAVHEASAAVEVGNLEKAHAIYAKIKKECADYPATQKIRLPLLINTYPRGAKAVIDGSLAGNTPVLHYYKPGTKMRLSLSRSSCETRHTVVQLQDQWELHFKLERRPLGAFTPVDTIEQPMLLAGKNLIIASRDGNLYAVDPRTQATTWQRTVGRFGDRISNLAIRGNELYLGTVSAEVTAISARTGKSRWISRVDASVLAEPAISEDGKWVAVASTRGSVHILDNENGSLVAKFSTENEVLAKPVFVKDLVVVASTDNYVYGYSLSQQKLAFFNELSDGVVLDPFHLDGGLLAVSVDGSIQRFDLRARKIAWSTELTGDKESPVAAVLLDSTVYVGTSSGHVISVDGRNGEILWKAQAGKASISGLHADSEKVYATLLDGRLIALDSAKHQPAWGYQSDSAILSPPIVARGIVYFGGDSGKVHFMEVLE